MPYLFRQSPLNAIWEGSGNVICLDVLRTINADKEYVPRPLPIQGLALRVLPWCFERLVSLGPA